MSIPFPSYPPWLNGRPLRAWISALWRYLRGCNGRERLWGNFEGREDIRDIFCGVDKVELAAARLDSKPRTDFNTTTLELICV